jgi:hypothetical protein
MKALRDPLSLILWLLCCWAGILALLSWRREPAAAPALPERMQLQGVWLQRSPKPIAAVKFPEALHLLSGADYPRPDGSRLVLRWLAHGSSGSGVTFELNSLNTRFLGSSRRGVCRVLDPRSGTLLGVAQTDQALQALLSRTNPRGSELLAWAMGLRGWRSNRCLFVGVAPP